MKWIIKFNNQVLTGLIFKWHGSTFVDFVGGLRGKTFKFMTGPSDGISLTN